MQRRVRQPDLEQPTAHGLRAEVKEKLVRRSGVDPYAAERPELFGEPDGDRRLLGEAKTMICRYLGV